MATVPEQIRALVYCAVRIAKAERTVTCIIIPNDLQEVKAEEPARAHNTIHTGTGYLTPRVIPASDANLRHAAEILNAGKRVAMLVGAGALNVTYAVIEVADKLGAGIAKALLGKAAVPGRPTVRYRVYRVARH